ncbi:MAG TPA: O-antigen ligase family protein, partial [bacterium]|nr:O-antigen ligase family protein [bacterium]
ALVIAGGLEALYGFIQTRMPQETVLWRIKEFQLGFATGSYFNRNHLAGFLELCLGINLAFSLISFRKHHQLLCFGSVLSTVVTFTGLLLTGSRMGIFSFMLSLFLLCFFIPRKEDRYRIFFAIGFLTLLAFVVGRPLWDLRLQEITDKIQPWEGGRLTVWKDALGMLKDHPWLGIGLGNFEWVFPRYQSETLLMGWAHAHNDYLELLIELGVPSFTVLLGVLSMIFLRLFRKFPSLDADASALVWGGLVSSTAFLIHGLTDFNFAIPANAFIFILLIGLMYRLSSLSGEKITVAL